MTRELIEALDNEVKTELQFAFASLTAYPITDGVVDVDLYLASSPKILWVLKEPVDEALADGLVTILAAVGAWLNMFWPLANSATSLLSHR